MIDLLIKGGTVVDGTGGPARSADVAVSDGRIVEIGRISAPARRTIAADGLTVTPGFIDHHTHYDAQLLWDPLATSSCWHGVTTVVTGNCGYSLAPCRPEDRDYLLRLFSKVEEVPEATLRAGVDWSWETFGEYLDRLDKRLGVNVAAQVGHNAIRRYTLGAAATERAATADELAEMERQVQAALAAGACGFATSDSRVQVDPEGKPVPSKWADKEEFYGLARAFGAFGRGQLALVPFSHTIGFTDDDIAFLERLAEESGRPVNWNGQFYNWSRPDDWRRVHDFMARAAERNLEIVAATRSQPTRRRFTLRAAVTFTTMPRWRTFVAQTDEVKRTQAQDPATRAELRAEIDEFQTSTRWTSYTLLNTSLPGYQAWRGKRLVDLAAAEDKHLADVLLDLSLAENFETEFASESTQPEDEAAIGAILKGPHNVPGNSDAGGHIASECLAGEHTYFLAHWIRDRKLMPLETAVQKITALPARLVGATDRGTLAPGQAADLAIFDLDRLGIRDIERAFDLPGGATRVVQRAEGMRYVVVNGEVLLEDGQHTGAYPGRTLRGAPASKPQRYTNRP